MTSARSVSAFGAFLARFGFGFLQGKASKVIGHRPGLGNESIGVSPHASAHTLEPKKLTGNWRKHRLLQPAAG